MEIFRQDCVKWHNYYRAMHHAPPLTNDPVLEKMAQEYAEKMAKTGNFAHSSPSERNDTGENIFCTPEDELSEELFKSKILIFFILKIFKSNKSNSKDSEKR